VFAGFMEIPMRVRDGALSALALSLLLVGACEYEEIGYWPDSEITVGKDIASSSADASSPDAGPTDGGEAPAPLTGPACTEDDDCESGTCVTTELLESFGATGLDIPGGLCSLLLCGSDDECGVKATCIDGAPFGAGGFQLCLPTCEGMSDCRWQEAWDCIAPLDDQPDLAVCLPDNVIVALECDDGSCEEE